MNIPTLLPIDFWHHNTTSSDPLDGARLSHYGVMSGQDHIIGYTLRSFGIGKAGVERHRTFVEDIRTYEGFRAITNRYFNDDGSVDDENSEFYFDWGFLTYRDISDDDGNPTHNRHFRFEVLGRERHDDFKRFVEDHTVGKRRVKKIPNSHPIKVLTHSHTGYGVTQLARISKPLNRINYEGDALKGFDFAKKHLFSSQAESGRLTILDGPPGTGKTYMVRALVTEAPEDVEFILLNTAMLEKLADPSLLQFLISHRGRMNEDSPIVLVLEDADGVLSKRQSKSMDPLSALLNLGDGIMGDALDIRVIATTNSPIEEFDSAILRPGRLCNHIQIGRLAYVQAKKLAEKLGVTLPYPQKSYTLAEVYALTPKKED